MSQKKLKRKKHIQDAEWDLNLCSFIVLRKRFRLTYNGLPCYHSVEQMS